MDDLDLLHDLSYPVVSEISLIMSARALRITINVQKTQRTTRAEIGLEETLK